MKVLYKVRVGQKYINSAKANDATLCAISQAIYASDPDIEHVSTTRQFVQITRFSTETVERYGTPFKGQKFVDAYDDYLNRGGQKPKAFDLVLTNEDWKSDRPRRLDQRGKAETIEKRKKIAAATGRPLSKVHPQETETFDSEGFADTKLAKDRVVRPSKRRVPQKKKNFRESVYAGEA